MSRYSQSRVVPYWALALQVQECGAPHSAVSGWQMGGRDGAIPRDCPGARCVDHLPYWLSISWMRITIGAYVTYLRFYSLCMLSTSA